MTNAPSMVKSDKIEAYWTSKSYMRVCEYEGENGDSFHIQNSKPGSIESDTVSIS
jgi:hypothetical protein